MLQPSVVDAVSATCSALMPTSAAISARSSSRGPAAAVPLASTLLEVALLLGAHRFHRPPAAARRCGVRYDPLEHGELRPCLLEGHPASSSTGA
jgi:hypothetical protein